MQNGFSFTIRKRMLAVLRAGSVILLLVFYAAGVLQVESLHAFLHDHQQEELHTLEQENDLCHRAIYHGEKQNDCGHKTHVKKSDSCSLCAVLFSTPHIYVEPPLLKSFNHAADCFFHKNFFIKVSSCHQRPSRAPPVA